MSLLEVDVGASCSSLGCRETIDAGSHTVHIGHFFLLPGLGYG